MVKNKVEIDLRLQRRHTWNVLYISFISSDQSWTDYNPRYFFYFNISLLQYFFHPPIAVRISLNTILGNTNWEGKLSTVDPLNKVASFVRGDKNILDKKWADLNSSVHLGPSPSVRPPCLFRSQFYCSKTNFDRI